MYAGARDATRVNGKIAKPRKKKLWLRCRHHYRRSRLRARFYVFYLWPRALCVNINNARVFGDRLHKKTSCSLTCVYWRLIKSSMRFAEPQLDTLQPRRFREKSVNGSFFSLFPYLLRRLCDFRTVHKSYTVQKWHRLAFCRTKIARRHKEESLP